MNLQARYDPAEDRMRLALFPAQDAPRAFLVTRRQWLGMLGALPKPAGAREDASSPAKKPQAPRALPEAVALQSIRLRCSTDGVRIVFDAGAEGKTPLTLRGEGVGRLRRMLFSQAERAGWDPEAALARLAAADLARAAVKKAQRDAG